MYIYIVFLCIIIAKLGKGKIVKGREKEEQRKTDEQKKKDMGITSKNKKEKVELKRYLKKIDEVLIVSHSLSLILVSHCTVFLLFIIRCCWCDNSTSVFPALGKR